MELIAQFFQIVLHLDQYLHWLLQNYGTWVYALLFLIIFCETGLVVTPFLPGDSLLFVVGAFVATGAMDGAMIVPLLMAASFLGDNTNYWTGRLVGPKIFKRDESVWFNRKYLDKTEAFYERHGGKTIILARFIPVIRTFAPFVAGIGRMAYPRFLSYSAAGALLWIGSLTLAGYLFGNIPVVKNNLTAVIFGIIILSVMPGIVHFAKARLAAK